MKELVNPFASNSETSEQNDAGAGVLYLHYSHATVGLQSLLYY